MKLLYLTTVLPHHKKTGGEIVSHQCIEVLKSKCHVDVLGYTRPKEKIHSSLNSYIVGERIIESKTSFFWTLFWLVLAFKNKRPFSSQKFYSKKYINILKNLIKKQAYDLVIIDHSQLSWVIDYIPKNIPIIFISHNVEYLVYKELSNQSKNKVKKYIYLRESKIMKQEEIKLLSTSHQTWTLSKSDKNKLNKLVDNVTINILDIPGGFDSLIQCEKKYDIGILGTWTWESNKKGLEWFFQNVFPLINSRYNIALGGNGSLSYSNLFPNVNTLGFVDNAQIFLSSCKIIVIPTIAGGGVQIKTLDAISTSCPIVTTSIGVRGIENLPNTVHVLDNPNDFANKINELLSTDNKFDKLGFEWSIARRKNFKMQLYNYIKDTI